MQKQKTEKSSVQVIIRVRPAKSKPTLSTTSSKVIIQNPRNTTELLEFNFQKVFKDESQQQVFEKIEEQLDQVFDGRNMTVFAYGQTGTGKTFTINGESDNPGLIPRTIKYLLKSRKAKSLKTTFLLSYQELYNEKLYDLLSPEKVLVEIREIDGQICCMPMKQVVINSLQEFNTYHLQAISGRRTASTNLNLLSSRSHFIMQLNIQTMTDNNTIQTSKLHMIGFRMLILDLAGSEDNKRTGNVGTRLVESASINTSLFVLGKVVEALNSNLSRIPYRGILFFYISKIQKSLDYYKIL
jgi:kinesin family protein 22